MYGTSLDRVKQLSAEFRSDPALAALQYGLDFRIARLDRECHQHLIDRVPHEDALELLEAAQDGAAQVVDRYAVFGIDEANDVVRQWPGSPSSEQSR